MTVGSPVAQFDSFRCSFGQRRLWLIAQIQPDSPAYNIHAAIRAPVPINPEHLSQAAAWLIRRHETLRTGFGWNGFEPVQQVWPAGAPRLRMLDLRGETAAGAGSILANLSRAEAATPFDLAVPPLLRLGLVRMPGGRDVLLITIHHIIADAWSMSILLRDLWALYGAAATGRQPDLPALPIQYADFSDWQRDRLEGAHRAELLDFWTRMLAGAARLDLPTDHPRRPLPSHAGQKIDFSLPAPLSVRILDLGRALGVTPYVILTTCLGEVLHRYGGCDDFLIGMPVAGRNESDLNDLVGFFVNSLALRLDFRGGLSAGATIARVGAAVREALAHQDLPFEQLVEAIAPGRDLTSNPLFEVTSQFLASPLERRAGGALDLVDLHRGFANFELTFDFWADGDRIGGRVEFATDLFRPQTVQRMVGHLQTLLAEVVAHPDRPLAALKMLTDGELARIDAWGKGPEPARRPTSLPDAFAMMLRRAPDAPAIVDTRGTLSYAELDRRARGLAQDLLAMGLAGGDCVALSLPRGREQIIAMLGIVQAGGAYMAIDPAWPDARIARMIAESGARLMVAGEAEAGRWAALGLTVAGVTDAAALPPSLPLPLPLPEPGADAIAYVAYTSGSTGRPKGVPATHGAVLRLICGGAPIDLGPGDVMLAYAPLAFDASTLEIWGPLLNGACVAPAPPVPLLPDELADVMAARGVTCAWLTAGLFTQMSETRPLALARLRRLFAGGDVLPLAAVRRVIAAGGAVVNGYGPTENCVFTCCHEMRGEADIAQGIRIGRPVPGTDLRILDPAGRPTPIGVPGELVVGGAGVAPGYLGDHPDGHRFHAEPGGGRTYRTGDLVRWAENGEIEFLGRRDRQVKIRGYRVEPGEIEHAIAADPAVRHCIVAVRDEAAGPDRKALAAFVVLKTPDEGVEPLRRRLEGQLPAHMIPSCILAVADFPLGENGKVDVAALLALDPGAGKGAGADAADADAEGEIEELVAQTFAQVLSVAQVSPLADFFTLGGHSLHATRVVTRLREALAIDLPLVAIFERPTVRGLSARIEDILLGEFVAGGEEAAPHG